MKNRGCIKNVRMTRKESGKSRLNAGHSVIDGVKQQTANDTNSYQENDRTNDPFSESFSKVETMIMRVNGKEILLNKVMSPATKRLQ